MAHPLPRAKARRSLARCLVFLTGLSLWTGTPLATSAQEPPSADFEPAPPGDLSGPPGELDPAPPGPPGGPRLTLLETLELALENDPNIAQVQAGLDGAGGSLMVARSAFDPLLTSDVLAGQDRDAEPDEEFLQASVGGAVLLRSGLALSTAVGLTRVTTDGEGGAANAGTLSVTLRQPLARGRGRAIATTAEQIAEQELEAVRGDLEQQVAFRLRTVAGLYWSYLSAAENLDILRDTEARSRRFLDNTRRLVDADLTPAADLVQLEANLLSRELSRRSGERRLVEARQELGREIGLPAAEILALPLPGDPYPPLDPAAAPSLAEAPDYIALALARRSDLRASALRVEEDRLQLRFLQNALLPQLDLVLTPAYSNALPGAGLGDFFAPLTRDLPGLSTTLGLSWRFAPPNRLARGNLAIQDANLRRTELALERIEVQIGADLPTALNDVAFNAEQLAKSLEALDLFRRALDNEEKKLRAGSSTLIDVLNQQDQLIAARQTVNDSRFSLAQALLRLRFETGTLIESPSAAGEPALIDLAAFLTLPQPSR